MREWWINYNGFVHLSKERLSDKDILFKGTYYGLRQFIMSLTGYNEQDFCETVCTKHQFYGNYI
jgi:hypothetical protein